MTPTTFLGLGIEAWASVAISLALSIPVAWFFWYRLPRRSPGGLTQLTANIGGVGAPDIPELADKLAFLFNGEPVSSVTVTAIGVWNSGRAPILRSQLAHRSPLRIEVAEGSRLLQATVTGVSAAHNDAKVAADPITGVVEIDFEFLDEGDGFVVQVIHTAGPNGARACGYIIGQPGGVIAFRHPAKDFLSKSLVLSFAATVAAIAVASGASILARHLALPPKWVSLGPVIPAVGLMLWAVFGAGPQRAVRKLPAVIRSSPGLLAAEWPTL